MASFFDEPSQVVPLITCIDGAYAVHQDTLDWIRARKTPFAVVACAGRYRTGKSFLLNQLTNAEAGSGFGVGDSVQACTKGLWVFKQWVRQDDKDILFMDTEGIDALDANDTHDVRIFTLALLLCSAFLYNSVGAIDETAMQTLSLMTRVTNSVRVHAEDKDDDEGTGLGAYMPAFYWVLRDFSLRLVAKDGRALSHDDYLESALQTADPQKDIVRAAIRDSFPTRALITLSRPCPTEDATALQRRPNSVTQKFLREVEAFRGRLGREVPFFRSNGALATGPMFAVLCAHLANVVQTDAVPVMRDSWTLMAIAQAKDLRDGALEGLDEKLAALSPMPPDELTGVLSALSDETLASFDQQAMQPVDAETRAALASAVTKRIDAAAQTLTRDLREEVALALEAVADDVLKEPERATEHLERAEAAFEKKTGQTSGAAVAWRSGVGGAAVKWITELGASMAHLHADLERQTLAHAALTSELEAAPTAQRAREKELLQTIEARGLDAASALARAQRAECEVILLAAECRTTEAAAASRQAAPAPAARATADLVDDDDHAQLRAEFVRAQALLQEERLRADDLASAHAHAQEQLEQARAVHGRLEASWANGLDELRASEQRCRQEFKAKLETAEQKLQTAEERAQALDKALQTQRSTGEAVAALHATEREQLKSVVQSHREQCEAAQGRVLEIHRDMLQEIQLRDERMQKAQQAHVKDRITARDQVCELQLLLESTNKRAQESDNLERELKRQRTERQTDQLTIARLDAENAQLRSASDALKGEREDLRRETMSMAGELALLRAEKKLSEARENFHKAP